jgi:hypothetical protein
VRRREFITVLGGADLKIDIRWGAAISAGCAATPQIS